MTVDEIVEAAGSVGKLAALCGVSHSSVCDWRRRERIPVERALQINDKLDIPLYKLRPDIWSEPRGSG